MKIYINKLSSMNPIKYMKMELETAMTYYYQYVLECIGSHYFDKDKPDIKSFEMWRSTEI